jgi:hypothetical protein
VHAALVRRLGGAACRCPRRVAILAVSEIECVTSWRSGRRAGMIFHPGCSPTHFAICGGACIKHCMGVRFSAAYINPTSRQLAGLSTRQARRTSSIILTPSLDRSASRRPPFFRFLLAALRHCSNASGRPGAGDKSAPGGGRDDEATTVWRAGGLAGAHRQETPRRHTPPAHQRDGDRHGRRGDKRGDGHLRPSSFDCTAKLGCSPVEPNQINQQTLFPPGMVR